MTTTPPIDPGQASDDDLAFQRPGALVQQRAHDEWSAAKSRSKWRAYLGRAVGAKTEERAWRVGAEGERIVGQALEKLNDPWRVLHSVPVGDRGSDIDHVVIGPGGVFTVNSKHHPDQRITIYPNAVYIAGQSVPYLRNSRHEASRASRLLTAAVGLPVAVTPILAIVDAKVTVKKGGPDDVLVVTGRLVKALTKRPVALPPEQMKAIYAVARRAATWR